MKSVFMFILLFSILLSCSKVSQENKEAVVTIAISKDSCRTFQFSKYLENPVFIPLETSQNSMIGQISKLEITDDYIFILDKDITKNLFLFAKDGKFIRKIGRQGKGPHEYISIDDFFFDPKKQQIQMLDNQTTQIKIFDMEGNFIRAIKTGLFGTYGFAPLSKADEYILFGINDNYLNIFSENKISKTLLPKSKNENTIFFYPSNYMFSSYQDEVFSYVPFSPIIYQVTNADIHPYYYFDFGKNSLPQSFFETHDKDNWNKGVTSNKYVYTLSNLSHTNDYLLLSASYGSSSFSSLISRKNNQPVISTKRYKDDLTFVLPYPHKIYGANKLVAITEPTNWSNYKKAIAFQKKDPQPAILNKLKELEQQVKNSDNPVLVIYDIKQQDE